MQSIPTWYRNIRFRSRLEARWASFFDAIEVSWTYEPQGYSVCGIPYLPDFWLPEVSSRGVKTGVFFEVKPCAPDEMEERKARSLAAKSGRPVIVTCSSPKSPDMEALNEYVCDSRGEWEDQGLAFGRCQCGQVDIAFYARERQCLCGAFVFTPWDAKLMDERSKFNERVVWEAA